MYKSPSTHADLEKKDVVKNQTQVIKIEQVGIVRYGRETKLNRRKNSKTNWRSLSLTLSHSQMLGGEYGSVIWMVIQGY